MSNSATAENQVIVIYADDKKGLLGQILMFFNRRNITICDINVSRTDIRNMVLITIEVEMLDTDRYIIDKIGNIIEVYQVAAYPAKELQLNKIAFFKVSRGFLESGLWPSLQKLGASITEIYDNTIVIQKIGSEADLDQFYQYLDSEFLIGYCKSGLITSKSLIAMDSLFVDA